MLRAPAEAKVIFKKRAMNKVWAPCQARGIEDLADLYSLTDALYPRLLLLWRK